MPRDENNEQHLNFNVPIIEKPTLIEKAKVAMHNYSEYAKVEIYNAKETFVAEVMNAGEVIKEGLQLVNDKFE